MNYYQFLNNFKLHLNKYYHQCQELSLSYLLSKDNKLKKMKLYALWKP